MPIPSPAPYRRSNVTKEQRKEQLAACYGVTMSELSHEEIQRMRQIVQEHDAKRQPLKTIDLNNPPRVPYRYQKFPKMVYDLARSTPGHIVSLVVRNEQDLADSEASGYSDQAPSFGEMPAETELSASLQMEVNRLQTQLEESRRRGPGRPRKEVA